MRLRVDFGSAHSKEVEWDKKLEDFPKLISFLGKNYEWVIYGVDPSGKVDMILTFSKLGSHDPTYFAYAPAWDDLFPEPEVKCECGAAHSSFSWDHMRMCPLWRPW